MVYIIIVSHGHEDYIKKLLENLNADDEHYKIIVRDNKDSLLLKQICQHYAGLDYISGGVYGFGHNNNIAVAYVKEKYRPADDDYILFLNPDIIMKHDDLLTYIKCVESKRYAFSTLCLFRDEAKSLHDYSVRKFPVLSDFIVSFMLGINKTKIPKESIYSDTVVDWCAGSFMLVRFSDFVRVNGFDQGYFMYCEDIDLCLRLSLAGVRLHYVPAFHAIHYAHHDNRSFFSKAFRWHLKSTFRYLARKRILSNRNFDRISSVFHP